MVKASSEGTDMEPAFEDKWVIERIIRLANHARSRGDSAVGCVIARDGVIIAEAFEQVNSAIDAAGHAEILAIRLACRALDSLDLTGCTLFTNVEPCWMCSYAIRDTGISEVVIGMAVPDIGGVTSRYPILSDPDIDGWRDPPVIRWVAFDYVVGSRQAAQVGPWSFRSP